MTVTGPARSRTVVERSGAAVGRRPGWRGRSVRVALEYGLLLVFLLVFVGLSLANEFFLTSENLLNIGRQTAPVLLVAVAMTFVISTAGIDLSVGAIVAVMTTALASLLQLGAPAWLAILVVLLLSVAIGSVNGYFIAYQGIPAFVVTLAMLTSLRGVSLIITEGRAIPITDPAILAIGRRDLFGIPAPVAVCLIAVGLGAFFLSRTRFGTQVLATGGNEEAARLVGVNVRRIKLAVYMLSGLASGVAALIISGRVGAGSPNTGIGMELDVITAV
ncbi:MAG: ABC transporter permease, partial [Chloroflexi bacterium]|nr:ABC transporter permease [Chloroflexota bacterium]